MKKLFTTSNIVLFTHFSAQTRKFMGAWFEVEYPSDFTVRGSMISQTKGDGSFDSAFFTSPDGSVEFYIFSPKRKGEAMDITLQYNEKEGSHEKQISRKQTITSWTISDKKGTYARSYQKVENHYENTIWMVGVKYKNKRTYNRYKRQFAEFKKSLIQHINS